MIEPATLGYILDYCGSNDFHFHCGTNGEKWDASYEAFCLDIDRNGPNDCWTEDSEPGENELIDFFNLSTIAKGHI